MAFARALVFAKALAFAPAFAVASAVVSLAACASGSGARPDPQPPRAGAPEDPLDAGALMRDVDWLVAPDLAGRGPFQPGGLAAADRVAAEFRRAGLDVVRQPIPGGAGNVFGLLRAGEQAVIVSAHYDHLGRDPDGTVYPGADDNASGVAVLLALARAAADRARARDGGRTLVFAAFGAEEPGLVGSEIYIREPLVPLADTVAVINFDMVGRRFFESGSGKPATAAVVGLEGHPGARRRARRAARAVGLDLVQTPADLSEVFNFHDRTDDWWFRRRGIFAVHFSTGMHADYHRPSDTADKLVPAQMERIARTADALVRYLASPAAPR